jgi:RNA polymerase sigma-70 factor (ECF subfamily)
MALPLARVGPYAIRELPGNSERPRLLMFGCHDDKSLIEACRAGNTEAFGFLVSRYQDRLYPTIFRLTGCAEEAHDLLQDAFLRAFEKLERFQGESSFYTWVYRIAVNLALSGRRRRRPVLRLNHDVGGSSLDPTYDPAESDPSAPLERAERDRLIQDALNALAADHRAVVVMKEFDGLHYEEIAAMLGIPVGTVRSRLHRARCELRDRLRTLIDEDAPVRQSSHNAP